MREKIRAELLKLKQMPTSALILIIVMSLTVLSFFAQSSLSRDASAEESRAVAGFLSSIISYDSYLGRFIIDNIRKIGHFCEYGLFGFEAMLYVSFFVKEDKRFIAAFRFAVLAVIVALIDETVQIFSGRGPSVADVWLDSFGFVSVGAATLIAAFVLRRFIKASKENK